MGAVNVSGFHNSYAISLPFDIINNVAPCAQLSTSGDNDNPSPALPATRRDVCVPDTATFQPVRDTLAEMAEIDELVTLGLLLMALDAEAGIVRDTLAEMQRASGCLCRAYLGDNDACPIHGKEPKCLCLTYTGDNGNCPVHGKIGGGNG